MLRRAFIVLLIACVAVAIPLPTYACAMQGGKPCGSQGPARMTMTRMTMTRLACPAETAGISCHCILDPAPQATLLPTAVTVPTPVTLAAARPAATGGMATPRRGVAERSLTPTASQARLCTFLI